MGAPLWACPQTCITCMRVKKPSVCSDPLNNNPSSFSIQRFARELSFSWITHLIAWDSSGNHWANEKIAGGAEMEPLLYVSYIGMERVRTSVPRARGLLLYWLKRREKKKKSLTLMSEMYEGITVIKKKKKNLIPPPPLFKVSVKVPD